MTYVFDIDGTICTMVDDGDYANATPLKDRIAVINRLYDAGNTIIFQTARGMGRSGNSQAYAWDFFADHTKKTVGVMGCKVSFVVYG